MDNNNKNDRENSPGYIMGTVLGTVLFVCLTTSIIAITIKFLGLLF